jgi:DNA invertase Pin-like site-specific DNA recombinase
VQVKSVIYTKATPTKAEAGVRPYWKAAVYCRLSKDDDLQGESASISNQRDLLTSYCEGQGWEVVQVFQDDGFTGLNMDRPGLKRLLKAVEEKRVNLVITKDLSRLSRNYLEAGNLTEDFFPRHQVRYIALNDAIDTMRENNDIAPFKNILNEMYSKDISKKVHSSYYLKATQGKFTGCVAPIGYKKDPDDKNHLIIDEETAWIVKKIFGYAAQGHGPNYIRRRLEEARIPCPTWWNRQKGLRAHLTKWETIDPENGRFMWDFSVIQDILRNPVYIGSIASQKKNYRFKVGVIGEKKPGEWIVVDEVHEPIVDRQTFETVQRKVISRQRPDAFGNYSLFSGLIKCGECGKALTVRRTNAKNPIRIYSCVTYNKFGSNHCTQHRVEYDLLYNTVLEEIRRVARRAIRDRDAAMTKYAEILDEEQEKEVASLEAGIRKSEDRLDVLERMMNRLYEDMISGKLANENFEKLIEKAQDEQSALIDRISRNREDLAARKNMTVNSREWIDLFSEYADIEELDPDTLHRLVREIVIHEEIDDDGNRSITIEIHFNLNPCVTE